MRSSVSASRILTLIGCPGAGKGTQSKLLQKEFGIVPLSTGAMIRAKEGHTDEVGLILAESARTSNFAPDDIMIKMIRERTAQEDCQRGYILDGFPRTVNQALALDDMLTKNGQDITVIQLSMDDNIILKRMTERLTGRLTCPKCEASYHNETKKPIIENICDICTTPLYQRKEDSNIEHVETRLEDFKAMTQPVVEYYKEQGRLLSVQADQAPEKVFSDILALIAR